MLTGPDPAARRAVAARACANVGADLWVMPAALLPSATTDLADLIRLWEREAHLYRRSLLLEFGGGRAGGGSLCPAVHRALPRDAVPERP